MALEAGAVVDIWKGWRAGSPFDLGSWTLHELHSVAVNRIMHW